MGMLDDEVKRKKKNSTMTRKLSTTMTMRMARLVGKEENRKSDELENSSFIRACHGVAVAGKVCVATFASEKVMDAQ